MIFLKINNWKLCQMSFVVQNLASKNEPHIFHFSKKLKNNYKVFELQSMGTNFILKQLIFRMWTILEEFLKFCVSKFIHKY